MLAVSDISPRSRSAPSLSGRSLCAWSRPLRGMIVAAQNALRCSRGSKRRHFCAVSDEKDHRIKTLRSEARLLKEVGPDFLESELFATHSDCPRDASPRTSEASSRSSRSSRGKTSTPSLVLDAHAHENRRRSSLATISCSCAVNTQDSSLR